MIGHTTVFNGEVLSELTVITHRCKGCGALIYTERCIKCEPPEQNFYLGRTPKDAEGELDSEQLEKIRMLNIKKSKKKYEDTFHISRFGYNKKLTILPPPQEERYS